MIVKEGSLWEGSNSQKFRVIHVIDIHDHTWVHYRKDKVVIDPEDPDNSKEYSCYLESFITRFRQVPE